MAFLPHPSLPSPHVRRRNPSINITTCAVEPGYISVSRRRRVYDFLAASADAQISNPSTPACVDSEFSDSSAPSPYLNSSNAAAVPDSASAPNVEKKDLAAIRQEILRSIHIRNKIRRQSDMRAATFFKNELDGIRIAESTPVFDVDSSATTQPDTKSPLKQQSASLLPVEKETTHVSKKLDLPAEEKSPSLPKTKSPIPATAEERLLSAPPAATATSVSSSSTQLNVSSTLPKTTRTESNILSSTSEEERSPTAVNVDEKEKKRLDSVLDLYSPSTKNQQEDDRMSIFEQAFQQVSDFVESGIDHAKETFHDIAEASSGYKNAETEATEKKLEENKPQVEVPEVPGKVPRQKSIDSAGIRNNSSGEPSAVIQSKDQVDRSIGKVILDAIVDGVPEPSSAEEPQSTTKSDLREAQSTAKSDLNRLIDSGKIKNLTVSKLRRLLASNDLKTSGRKSELIARLVSFAKN